ncbi:Gfo/Idh/MocA family protein [Aristophania vespae]|uniref:Gfo/Idh/MocA family protein n=1 Tax=Aristophania vespae TaxID=2697033 RepID=UPI002351857B|nr:Gfo/Idh/MocA family oxidoreductase [Aristophania vespae]UMM63211.1 Glucose--fructose oxidoreductase [Aristophania vespae]
MRINLNQENASKNKQQLGTLPPLSNKVAGRVFPNFTRLLACEPRKFGYAIVGLGNYAINQILPAFSECQHACVTALVSGNKEKSNRIAEQYGIEKSHLYSYEDFDKIADDPEIDAVYIILPNSLHAEFTIRAFKAGKHVLCEKPMAVTVEECQNMIKAGKEAGKKLMIGYRCHFDPVTQKAISIACGDQLGKLKIIETTNAQMLNPTDSAGQWRLNKKLAGGGSLIDNGIYGINGSRYLLNEDPIEVKATFVPTDNPIFKEVEDRILWAMFYRSGVVSHGICSYSTNVTSHFSLIGDKATLLLDPATTYWANKVSLRQSMHHISSFKSTFKFDQLNQFSAQLDHLPISIARNSETLATGEEGMQDLRLIKAIYEAAYNNSSVSTDWGDWRQA